MTRRTPNIENRAIRIFLICSLFEAKSSPRLDIGFCVGTFVGFNEEQGLVQKTLLFSVSSMSLHAFKDGVNLAKNYSLITMVTMRAY